MMCFLCFVCGCVCENATMRININNGTKLKSWQNCVVFFNLGESMLTLMPGQKNTNHRGRTTVKSRCQFVAGNTDMHSLNKDPSSLPRAK